MKSIMQEASSIAKAIEQGWVKAGQPTDFSIKILEQPQKNFFGMTTHPAKIAFYFDEKPASQPQRHYDPHAQKPRKIHVRELHEPQPTKRHERVAAEPQIEHGEHKNESAAPQGRQHRYDAQWDEAMIHYTREWLTYVLQESCGKQVPFKVEPNNLYLRITFTGPVLDNQEKEKRFFASLSLLILEALKRNFRVGLRKHKIILTHS